MALLRLQNAPSDQRLVYSMKPHAQTEIGSKSNIGSPTRNRIACSLRGDMSPSSKMFNSTSISNCVSVTDTNPKKPNQWLTERSNTSINAKITSANDINEQDMC